MPRVLTITHSGSLLILTYRNFKKNKTETNSHLTGAWKARGEFWCVRMCFTPAEEEAWRLQTLASKKVVWHLGQTWDNMHLCSWLQYYQLLYLFDSLKLSWKSLAKCFFTLLGKSVSNWYAFLEYVYLFLLMRSHLKVKMMLGGGVTSWLIIGGLFHWHFSLSRLDILFFVEWFIQFAMMECQRLIEVYLNSAYLQAHRQHNTSE